jgi:hypothetical protein
MSTQTLAPSPGAGRLQAAARAGPTRASSWSADRGGRSSEAEVEWGFVVLAIAHGAVLCLAPTPATVALGLWWNANTISHNFIHRPFFRRKAANALFSLYLTALLGVPQALWRERHLAHHAGRRWRWRWQGQMIAESLLAAALWAALVIVWPELGLTVYLPGFAAGLALCAAHGYYEHAGGATSHYGRIYNWLFFNDGYHVEHHASPGRSWRRLREHREPGAKRSRWPAVLRWIERLEFDAARLDRLEFLILGRPWMQRFVVSRHARALARLRRPIGAIRRVAIVGGGLFPRTVIVASQMLPEAELVVIDANARHLEIAGEFHGRQVETVHAWYDPALHAGYDLVIIPLAYIGDREALYRKPPAPKVLVHDWLWRRRGKGTIVSLLLLKRLNLVER